MDTTTIRPLPSHTDLRMMEIEAADLATQLGTDEPEARQTLAREYGFYDWGILVNFIEGLQQPESLASYFETAVDAIVGGDEPLLRRMLAGRPELVRTRSMRIHGATLLHYTAANGIENFRQRTPLGIVPIVRLLLAAGAEVDAALIEGGGGTTLGLAATSVHPARAGVQLRLMELLLDAGAAVDGPPGGWQPMMAALANARPEAAALLADRGAYMTIVAAAGLGRETAVRSFFNTAGEYMPTREKVWHVPEDPKGQLARAFMYACIYGHTAIAAFLTEKGVDPGVQDYDSYTGLHWAAHGGHVDTVQFLLERKVPLELKNCHDGTVMGQLLWSASNNAGGWGGNKPDADYPTIAKLLITAGAVVEPGTLAWWRGVKDIDPGAHARMEEVLRRHAAARRPTITSAVSRRLVVKDVDRSIIFFVEILDFAVDTDGDAPSVIYGPARVLFHTSMETTDSTGPLRSAGSAMVFFEVNDLAAFWDKLYARGAQPTAPEEINWIKYTMFEVRDPDGHRLWFGESYHYPPVDLHTPPGKGQLRQIMPAFPCADVGRAVSYYKDVLGFSVNYQQHDLGVMDRDTVRLLLVARREGDVSTAACCVYIENADMLHTELSKKGALVQDAPVSHPWGLREFKVLDIDGNEISFAQTFE
ncbi:MAG: ankyrin repeat domain-containing protein [Chitinophagaceae bacterium]|nr:ankyrin repeat domain-containing protein [Chitinophagaceae bacterium]